MIEELLIEKQNIEEEYKEEISNLDNRIKILSKNMFIIYENFYKQNFIITNPYYKYNIELNMKYISLDIIYKCIERLNLEYIIPVEKNYEIYRKEQKLKPTKIQQLEEQLLLSNNTENNLKYKDEIKISHYTPEFTKENTFNIILNIKYYENKYLFLEYSNINNTIDEIPISKNNLLKLLYYISNNEVYKIVKKLNFHNFCT